MFRLGKKIFVKGPPPPPQVKGKIFDTRFGLIHVQTEKKNFCQGTPPPRIARNCYCYAAGGMPLAFTQEDFLVVEFVNFTQDTRDKEPRPQSEEDKETKWVEPAPVSFDDLMARIRHIVLTERLRVCFNWLKGKLTSDLF